MAVLLRATLLLLMLMTHKHSDYMRWSKTQSRARFNLATSGVAPFPLRELPVQLETLEINGDYGYGHPPLQKAIAAHHGVDPDCVVESAGTSMANHLAMAAMIEPGDEVLIEHPAYGPILDVARYLHADVKRFLRTRETGWVVDSAEILRAITPKTRLIVITNLHNPTSALTPDPVLREVGDIARSIGALVLVDEVYLDAVYQRTPRTSFHLGPEFVVTSSLTKVYGVSGLRCGWILARPDLAWKMRSLNDLYSATPVYPGLLLSVAVFKHLNRLREKARPIVEADRKLLRDFLRQQPALSAAWPDWGTTSFVQLRDGNADDFLERLRTEFDTSAVPGRFFEMSDHLRIGMGVNTEMFAEGLNRISQALGRSTK
ncbi:MAG TPA: aminotransferase class I/II-fold pyridoxal phosphate-dependent enzyme [Candidatus Udaeobacter sp.]|nr:aminotransferase class I/II-fold pyridoxal phosphate-dependent enzyme [Candidatus Udaeobacter sp.]